MIELIELVSGRRLVKYKESSAGFEKAFYLREFIVRIHPKGVEVEKKHLVERSGWQDRIEQILMEDLGFPRSKVRFVPLPCCPDHRLRTIDRGDAAGIKPVADQADHVAITAADLENVIVWLDV